MTKYFLTCGKNKFYGTEPTGCELFLVGRQGLKPVTLRPSGRAKFAPAVFGQLKVVVVVVVEVKIEMERRANKFKMKP